MAVNDRADIAVATIPAAQPGAEIDKGGGGAVSLGVGRLSRRPKERHDTGPYTRANSHTPGLLHQTMITPPSVALRQSLAEDEPRIASRSKGVCRQKHAAALLSGPMGCGWARSRSPGVGRDICGCYERLQADQRWYGSWEIGWVGRPAWSPHEQAIHGKVLETPVPGAGGFLIRRPSTAARARSWSFYACDLGSCLAGWPVLTTSSMTSAPRSALRQAIDRDRYPMSPRMKPFKTALAELYPASAPNTAVERPPLREAPAAAVVAGGPAEERRCRLSRGGGEGACRQSVSRRSIRRERAADLAGDTGVRVDDAARHRRGAQCQGSPHG